MFSIKSEIFGEFSQYAKSQPDREACALVITPTGLGDQEMITCENVHPTPETDFTISAEDWAKAEDKGEIMAVIHSHPGDGCRAIFSPTDVQSCNFSGVMWALMATESGEWGFMYPSEQPLTGRVFILGDTDCYGLVMAWHSLQGVNLKDFRVNYPWWERGEDLYMDNYEAAGFEECDISPGCMVIMQVRSPVPNHAGIVTEDGMLLHHLYGKKSEIIPFERGYFRDRVIKCVRHKDLPKEIKPWK